MVLTRTAKSCRSDAPRSASSLREDAQATVSNKPGHRGEREVRRKTIARGMPGDFRCDLVTTLVRFLFCTRGCGCIERPAFPAPSDFRGQDILSKTRAKGAARSRCCVCKECCCLKTESGRHHLTGLMVRDERRCRAPHHEG